MWGTAGVPGYDAGRFVRSGYKWTAHTTELHPDGECKHRPPQGEAPGDRTRASVKAPPPASRHRGAARKRARGKMGETTQGDRGPPADPRQEWREPQPGPTARTGEGPQHTTPTPTQSRQPDPREVRAGKQTHHRHTTHAPAHTQHRPPPPPQPPPTQAQQTHKTHESTNTGRTTNTHNTGDPHPRPQRNQQPSARNGEEPTSPNDEPH